MEKVQYFNLSLKIVITYVNILNSNDKRLNPDTLPCKSTHRVTPQIGIII